MKKESKCAKIKGTPKVTKKTPTIAFSSLQLS